jgi:hypothetical protein
LVVQTDTVLPGTVALEGFQPIAWRNAQVFQSPSDL